MILLVIVFVVNVVCEFLVILFRCCYRSVIIVFMLGVYCLFSFYIWNVIWLWKFIFCEGFFIIFIGFFDFFYCGWVDELLGILIFLIFYLILYIEDEELILKLVIGLIYV